MSKNKDKLENLNVEEPTDTINIQNNIDEINYDLVASGPLYIDHSLKLPGFIYKWISDEPGNIANYQRLGYEMVKDDRIIPKDQYASTTSRFGSVPTVQSKCGIVLVLMAVSEENHEKYEAHKDNKSRQRVAALGHAQGIPEEYQSLNGRSLNEFKITKK